MIMLTFERYGLTYGIFISVPLGGLSHIWDLEHSVTTHNCQIQMVVSRVDWRLARETCTALVILSQLCSVFNHIMLILSFRHLNTHKY